MFKVECPGCKAPYQVDERRVPQTGLKMRCPKCGSSFKVDPPGEAALPAPLNAGLPSNVSAEESAPRPPPVRRNTGVKATMLGVAPAAGRAAPPRAGGAPAVGAAGPAPAAVQSSAVQSPAVQSPGNSPASPAGALGADLPVPVANVAKAPAAGARPAAPRPANAREQLPSSPLGFSPAPAAAAPGGFELDLPDLGQNAVRGAPVSPAIASPAAPAKTATLPGFAIAPSGTERGAGPSLSEAELPAVGGARAATQPERAFGEVDLDLPARPQPPAEPPKYDLRKPAPADLPGIDWARASSTSPGAAKPDVKAAQNAKTAVDLPAQRAKSDDGWDFAGLPDIPAAALPSLSGGRAATVNERARAPTLGGGGAAAKPAPAATPERQRAPTFGGVPPLEPAKPAPPLAAPGRAVAGKPSPPADDLPSLVDLGPGLPALPRDPFAGALAPDSMGSALAREPGGILGSAEAALPSVQTARARGAGSTPERRSAPELDLPSVSRSGLPTALGGRSESIQRSSLPPALGGAAVPDAFDLPSVSHSDLPSALGGSHLPSISDSGLPSALGGMSLPGVLGTPNLPNLGGPGLPTPQSAGLPSAGGGITPGLPSVLGPNVSDFGALDLEPPRPAAPTAPGFGELELPPLSLEQPQSARGALDSDPFGEAQLPPPRSFGKVPVGDPDFGNIGGGAAWGDPGANARSGRGSGEHPSQAPGSPQAISRSALPSVPAPVLRQSGGGIAYGEVNLGGDDALDVPVEALRARDPLPSEEDMEFGGVPQEAVKPPTLASNRPVAVQSMPVRAPSTRAAPPIQTRAKKGSKGGALKALALIGFLSLGGAALAFNPRIGPFGAHFVIDHVRAEEYRRAVDTSVARTRAALQSDTARAAAQAADEIDLERARLPRVRALVAYAAYLASLRELRFGAEPELHARSKVLLDELTTATEVPYLEIARAARAATDGQLARARQELNASLRRSPKDLDALVLSGEVELRARDAPAALAAWQTLAGLEASARASFGLARAQFLSGATAAADAEAKRVLEKNPEHVGAKILRARVAAAVSPRDPRAVELLEAITKTPNQASAEELVRAHTLLGDVHLSRSRMSRAEASYTEALKINPKAGGALIGLGEALYRAGRYSESQARFEAGVQADPDDVFAKVGVQKCKLALERVEEAHTALKKLLESHPTSPLVAYWYGRVLDTLGNRDEAERAYKDAINKAKNDSKAQTDPLLGEVYISLATLQNQGGRAEAATKTLAEARERLPGSPAIHRAQADVALSQGRYGEAQDQLKRALELDPEDLGTKFRYAVALSRDDKVDPALAVFEEVAKVDPEYPGLALERGLLLEKMGRLEQALEAYERALAKAPGDPDLLLRVGCGRSAAGRTREAEAQLRKVLELRPTSAETHFCLGRALLIEGTRLADAFRFLERAVELDPHRAIYFCYLGWIANEAGNVPRAEQALNKAIELDRGLADAYWQRGVLRQRQGQVRDAVQDLTRALELRPTRYEAHAALADAYYDLGKEALALAELQKAVKAQPDNATWHYRYGKLLGDNHMNDQARVELTRALELAAKSDSNERWLWEAHHRLARAIGPRPEAAPHWEEYLRRSPPDSPYREEARSILQKLGRPWTGN